MVYTGKISDKTRRLWSCIIDEKERVGYFVQRNREKMSHKRIFRDEIGQENEASHGKKRSEGPIVIGRGSKELASGKRLHVMLTIAY